MKSSKTKQQDGYFVYYNLDQKLIRVAQGNLAKANVKHQKAQVRMDKNTSNKTGYCFFDNYEDAILFAEIKADIDLLKFSI